MSIIVLGMHRSGTSAVGGLLHLLGAEYRADDKTLEMGPDDTNPKSYFERFDTASLNDDLLEMAGGSWSDTAALDLARLSPSQESSFKARASAIVTELREHPPYFIKDPRLCLTLPSWLPLLEKPLAVIVFRHPLEVARSLQARDEFSISFGLALWEFYSRSLLSVARGIPFLVLCYEEILEDPLVAAERILRLAADNQYSGLSMPKRDGITQFIDSSLYRNRRGENGPPSLPRSKISTGSSPDFPKKPFTCPNLRHFPSPRKVHCRHTTIPSPRIKG